MYRFILIIQAFKPVGNVNFDTLYNISLSFHYLDTSRIHCMFHLVAGTSFKHYLIMKEDQEDNYRTTLILIFKKMSFVFRFLKDCVGTKVYS